ncbi:hypothetical protein [Robinsoniella sp. RHS]|uniref:hypothetical protein n=1 Tax=Robinsoniella sp. RHS TaxID=1504536 RepID=UPI00064A93B8
MRKIGIKFCVMFLTGIICFASVFGVYKRTVNATVVVAYGALEILQGLLLSFGVTYIFSA